MSDSETPRGDELKEEVAKEMTIGMFGALASETPAPYVAEVDADYNSVTGDPPDGETAEGNINRRAFGKKRVYVDSPADAPDWAEVEEGPQGGTYYEVGDEEDGDNGPGERWDVTEAVEGYIDAAGIDPEIPENPDQTDVTAARNAWQDARDDLGGLIDEYGKEGSLGILSFLGERKRAIRNEVTGSRPDDVTPADTDPDPITAEQLEDEWDGEAPADVPDNLEPMYAVADLSDSYKQFRQSVSQQGMFDISNRKLHRWGRAFSGDPDYPLHDLSTLESGDLTPLAQRDEETYQRIAEARDGDGTITMYRAVPEEAEDIAVGDYVALNPEYVERHGESVLGEQQDREWKVLEDEVPVADVAWPGEAADEFVYSPKEYREKWPSLKHFYEDATEDAKAAKARRYVNHPDEVPDEYEPQEGPQGGIFYDPDDDGDTEDDVPTIEDFVQNIREFDEDDYEYGEWRDGGYLSDEDMERGVMIDVTDMTTFENVRAQIVNVEGDAAYAVTEEGEVINATDREQWHIDSFFDPMEWRDPDYEPDDAEDSDDDDDDADEDTAPRWADDTPLAEITESDAPEGGLEAGGLYHHNGDIAELTPDDDYNGDVAVYETDQSPIEFSAVDGILNVVGDANDIHRGETQYFDFTDESDLSDGWYQVEDDYVEYDDGSVGWRLYNDAEGEVELDASDVFDTLHGVHRPAENAYQSPELEATPEPSGSPDPDDWSIDWETTDDEKSGEVLPMAQKKLLMREWKSAVDDDAAESVSQTVRSVKDATYDTQGQKYDKLIQAVMGADGEPREGDFADADAPTEEEVEAMRVLQDASQKFFETHYGESTEVHRALADYSHERLLPQIGEMFAEGEELAGEEVELKDNPAGVWTTEEGAADMFTIIGGVAKTLKVGEGIEKDDVFNMPDAIYPYEQREETGGKDSDWEEGEVNTPSHGKSFAADEIMVVNAQESIGQEKPQAPLSQVVDDPVSVMEEGKADVIQRFVKTLHDLGGDDFYDSYVENLRSNDEITDHEDWEVVEQQIDHYEGEGGVYGGSIFDNMSKGDGTLVVDVKNQSDANWLNATREYVHAQADDDADDTKAAILNSLTTTLTKGRRYVDHPDEVPEGYEPQEGPQGGVFYEPDDGDEASADATPVDTDAESEADEAVGQLPESVRSVAEGGPHEVSAPKIDLSDPLSRQEGVNPDDRFGDGPYKPLGIKDDLLRNKRAMMDRLEEGHGEDTVDRFKDEMKAWWAPDGSYTEVPELWSVAMSFLGEDEYPDFMDDEDIERAESMDQEMVDVYADYYRLSQASVAHDLANEDGKIELYRGMTPEDMDEYGTEVDDGMEFEPQPLESWSTSAHTASNYARHGMVAKREVHPREVAVYGDIALGSRNDDYREVTLFGSESYVVTEETEDEDKHSERRLVKERAPVAFSTWLYEIDGDGAADTKTAILNSLTEKARRYVSSPEEVPEGYKPQEGPQGGIYYETEGTSEGQARLGPHDPDETPPEAQDGEEEEEGEEEGSDLPDGRTIPDEELRDNGIEDDLWHAAESGTMEDLEAAIEAYDGRHVKSEGDYHYYTALDEDGEPTVVEAEEDFVATTPAHEWVRQMDDRDLEDFLGYDMAEEHNEEFWRDEDEVGHATGPDSAAQILLSGELQRRNQTRGLGNRSVGRAVFTSRNTTFDAYGDVVFGVDVDAMREDGNTPMVTQEPQVEEARAREAVAREIGLPDYRSEIPPDISPDTAVFHDDIPLEYLSITAPDSKIEEIRSHIDREVEEGNVGEEQAEEAKEWLESNQTVKGAILSTFADSLEKRRYIDDPEDAPDDAEVQEGPQGGLYYETESDTESNDTEPESSTDPGETETEAGSDDGGDDDMADDRAHFVEEHPRTYSLLLRLERDFGSKIANSFLRQAADVVDVIEPEVVNTAATLFLSADDPNYSTYGVDLKHAKWAAKQLPELVREAEKGREYVTEADSYEEAQQLAPESVEVQEGEQGGFYYETTPDDGGDGDTDGEWVGIDDVTLREGMYVMDTEGDLWEVEAIDEMDGIGRTVRATNSEGVTEDFFPDYDNDLQAAFVAEDGPEDDENGGWVPHINEQGEQGYLNTATGEFSEGAKEPPTEIQGEPVSAENPLQEDDFVRLEYDDEVHYGFVYADRGNGEMLVIDDRNRWDIPKEGFQDGDPLHDMMDVERIGQPDDETVAPEDITIDSPDDAAYVLSELPTEGITHVADALKDGSLSVDELQDAAEETWGMLSTGSQLMERGGVGESEYGDVSLISSSQGKGDEGDLRDGFRMETNEDTAHTVARAARGWEAQMYQDPKAAPLVQYAMEQTGNTTTPEYSNSERAQNADVSDDDREAIAAISEFTTERLREAFGDEVTVFRGFARNPHQGTPSEGTDVVDRMEEAKQNDESVSIDHRPVESWSLNPEVASLYGAGGAVVKQTVPVEQIAMSSSTGYPDESEEDTLLFHDGEAEYDPDQIILDDERNDEEMKFRLQAEAVQEAG